METKCHSEEKVCNLLDIFSRQRSVPHEAGRRIYAGRPARTKAQSWLRRCEAGGSESFFIEGDEETFGSGEDGAFGAAKFGLVKELAAFAAQVTAD